MNVQSPEFWDQTALEKEWRRVFDLCHGCRRCFHLCPSFDFLFEAIDQKEEVVENLTSADFRQVLDLCYQCKLCYNHCPYTPPHHWAIDFPRLMLRAKAVQAKTEGINLSDRFLGNTDRAGRLGSMAAPIANRFNESRLGRSLVQGIFGVHKERQLPKYQGQTFSRWFRKRKAGAASGSLGQNGKAALFYTCFVNYNNPEVGKATVAVLEKNGVEVRCPPQRCCGMPYLDGGDIKSAVNSAKTNVKSFLEYVRQGYAIVVPGPTCSYMLKQEYPFLLGSAEARAVAEATLDTCEYLMGLHREGRLATDFQNNPGKIAYHLPCHLKAQNIGYKSMDLLRVIPGASVELVDSCAGIDGTWGLKKQYFELSLKVAGRLLRGVEEAEPDHVVSDCPLAAMQISQGSGREPKHPLEMLAWAYGLEYK